MSKDQHKPLSCSHYKEEVHNVFYSLLQTAAENAGHVTDQEGGYAEYKFLRHCTRGMFTAYMVEALEEHGYELRKIK